MPQPYHASPWPQLRNFTYVPFAFRDSGVIGTKAFVADCYRRFEDHFACRHPKQPQAVDGLDGVFALKRLRAAPT